VTQTQEPLTSLLAALAPNQEDGTPPPAAAWQRFARKHLRPDETVLHALEGEGWTWWDTLLLITDQRVVRIRQLPFQPWRVKQQAAPADVLGAEFRPWLISGIVLIRVRGARSIRVMSETEEVSREFVDRVNALVRGGRG
jgi:hypothetical protein